MAERGATPLVQQVQAQEARRPRDHPLQLQLLLLLVARAGWHHDAADRVHRFHRLQAHPRGDEGDHQPQLMLTLLMLQVHPSPTTTSMTAMALLVVEGQLQSAWQSYQVVKRMMTMRQKRRRRRMMTLLGVATQPMTWTAEARARNPRKMAVVKIGSRGRSSALQQVDQS